MKYRFQDEFDKIHRCVIVVIEDDVPHARTLYPYLMLFEEIKSRFLDGLKPVWISFLRERPAQYFYHLDTNLSFIRNIKAAASGACSPIPASEPARSFAMF